MQDCPVCGSEIREVPAGITKNPKSKMFGKPYKAFQICSNKECNFKPVEENGTVNEVVDVLPKTSSTAKTTVINKVVNSDMRLSYRKDLMCEVVRTYGMGGTGMIADVKSIFNDLWTEIEK